MSGWSYSEHACMGSGCCKCNKYGFFSFLLDVFMVGVTCGLWLIWIFVREMRRR